MRGVWGLWPQETFCNRYLLQDRLENLEKTRRPHAAADAHRDNAIACSAPPPFVEQVANATRAGHAVGMTDRDGPARDVEPVVGDAKRVTAIKNLRGKSLVQFPDADIVDRQPVPFEQA